MTVPCSQARSAQEGQRPLHFGGSGRPQGRAWSAWSSAMAINKASMEVGGGEPARKSTSNASGSQGGEAQQPATCIVFLRTLGRD